jgi:hypothetical protein
MHKQCMHMIWHHSGFEQSHMWVALQNDRPRARYDLARRREPQAACTQFGQERITVRGAERDEV